MHDSPFAPIVVIPARWQSTRFPGKMLHQIAGRPLIEHVWRRCCKARLIQRMIIATDDERIKRVAEQFGAEVMMTARDHESGTDRMAEIARLLERKSEISLPSHFINVQGDEPLIDPGLIDDLAHCLRESPELEMITAATAMTQASDLQDPNIVKVVLNQQANALYFSRAPIPFHRDLLDQQSAVTPLQHLGIYGFRKDILERFVSCPPSRLECSEKLEQLRALENGISIRVITTQHPSRGIDTLEEAIALEAALLKPTDAH